MGEIVVAEEIEHSILGASSMHRWSVCPGSVPLIASLGGNAPVEEGMGDEDGGPDGRAKGTAAHEIARICLAEEKDAWEFTGATVKAKGHDVVVDDDMVRGVQQAIDFVRGLVADGDTLMLENRVQLDRYGDGMFGTTDVAILTKDKKTLKVVDFKFGGKPVTARGNPQLRYYAVGIFCGLDGWTAANCNNVELHICQPTVGDGVSSELMFASDLFEWVGNVLVPAVARTKEAKPELVPGSHCSQCPAAWCCEKALSSFEDMEAVDAKELSGVSLARLGELAYKVAAARAACKAIENEVFERLRRGYEVPGWKLVYKRAMRVWKPGAEEEAIRLFGDDAKQVTFVSPAQLEKRPGGKEFVAAHAFKPVPGVTAAPADDNRDAIEPMSAKNAFKDIKTI